MVYIKYGYRFLRVSINVRARASVGKIYASISIFITELLLQFCDAPYFEWLQIRRCRQEPGRGVMASTGDHHAIIISLV